ncbi:hypothetical protein MKW94_003871 [Papaver nudicaule]|uniref:AP2/ERF domain-containing protein n=1 Tax=Papaver nudicaule TaxID=74823 RepID=A0AA41SEH3_PAPNU|nr:hypothetical protein [Papaver nudicaule]
MVNKSSTNSGRDGGNSCRDGGNDYKGVRMRKWGKWVSEIRMPKSRERIWLGSYDTAEKAARAYDAAVFCIRDGGGGLYNLNFPQNRAALENLLLPPSNASSSSSAAALNQFTRSQIQLAASKYAHSTNDVAAVAPALLPPTNSIAMSSVWPTKSLAMSSAVPVPSPNLLNLWRPEGLVASSPSEPSMPDQWDLSSNNITSDVLNSDQFYAASENQYSPVVAPAIEDGQGGEGMLEDAIAPPHGTSGGDGSGDGDGEGGAFYQSSSLDDPYYFWTY